MDRVRGQWIELKFELKYGDPPTQVWLGKEMGEWSMRQWMGATPLKDKC